MDSPYCSCCSDRVMKENPNTLEVRGSFAGSCEKAVPLALAQARAGLSNSLCAPGWIQTAGRLAGCIQPRAQGSSGGSSSGSNTGHMAVALPPPHTPGQSWRCCQHLPRAPAPAWGMWWGWCPRK